MIQHKKCRHTDLSTISPRPPTITTSQAPLRFADIPSIYPSASATWPVNWIPHRTGKNCKGTAWGSSFVIIIIINNNNNNNNNDNNNNNIIIIIIIIINNSNTESSSTSTQSYSVLPTCASTSGASPQGWFCIAAPAY